MGLSLQPWPIYSHHRHHHCLPSPDTSHPSRKIQTTCRCSDFSLAPTISTDIPTQPALSVNGASTRAVGSSRRKQMRPRQGQKTVLERRRRRVHQGHLLGFVPERTRSARLRRPRGFLMKICTRTGGPHPSQDHYDGLADVHCTFPTNCEGGMEMCPGS